MQREDPEAANTRSDTGRATTFQAAAGFSGIAALGLALLYAAGVVARSGELAAAGYSPQDIVPLVPFQQFLARGVGIATDPTVLVAGLVLIVNPVLTAISNVALDPSEQRWRAGRLRHYHELASATRALAEQLQASVDPGEPLLREANDRLDRADELLTSASN